jgi:hypothetical protein
MLALHHVHAGSVTSFASRASASCLLHGALVACGPHRGFQSAVGLLAKRAFGIPPLPSAHTAHTRNFFDQQNTVSVQRTLQRFEPRAAPRILKAPCVQPVKGESAGGRQTFCPRSPLVHAAPYLRPQTPRSARPPAATPRPAPLLAHRFSVTHSAASGPSPPRVYIKHRQHRHCCTPVCDGSMHTCWAQYSRPPASSTAPSVDEPVHG